MGRSERARRPELDGVRALAVLGVVLFHGAAVMRFKLWGGMHGADLFFVLSGFLITKLLVDQHGRSGAVDLRAFFLRRVLRLWPAMFVLFVLAGAVTLVVGAAEEGISLWQAVGACWLGIANWFQASSSKLGILNHTWYLSIDWQFYLAWPVVLLASLRRGVPLRRLAGATLVAAVAIAVARGVVYHTVGAPQALFWTFTRPDGLLLGSSLALAVAGRVRAVDVLRRPEVGGAAVVAAAVGVWQLSAAEPAMYEGGLFGLNLAFTAAVGHVALAADGPLSRLLRMQPLPALGRISYGLYLFNVPMNALLLPGHTGAGRVALAAIAALALAIASHHLVERPALRLKRSAPDGVPRAAPRVRELRPRSRTLRVS